MATIPTRIDQELFDAAKAVGEMHSRSATQQITYWARIGRELETAPNVTHDAIERVLSGEASYDDLAGGAQAVVRTSWRDQLAARIASLDFEPGLSASGLPWVEADADGNTVIRGGDRQA